MGLAEVKIEVVYASAPHVVDHVMLELPEGATVMQALEASGLLRRHEGLLDPARHRVGVWGRLAGLDQALRDRDRVEVYRPLTVDPKEARRLASSRARRESQGEGIQSQFAAMSSRVRAVSAARASSPRISRSPWAFVRAMRTPLSSVCM
jgi:uncharacterized protein